MSPDADIPPLALLLYLVAFAAGAAGIMLPGMAGRRSIVRKAGWVLRLLVLTGILPSLQVILDAMEITPNLTGAWPQVLTLLFNALTLLGIAATILAWSRLSALAFPGESYIDRFMTPLLILAGAAALVAAVSQSMALYRPGRFTFTLSSRSLEVFLLLAALVASESVIRSFRKADEDLSGKAVGLLRSFFLTIVTWVLLYLLLPDTAAVFIPPLGLLSLFVGTMVLYRSIPLREPDAADADTEILSGAGLTPREQEIALLLARGLSYKEISGQLFVSLSTVQTHVGRVYGKMDVNNKTELSRKLTGER